LFKHFAFTAVLCASFACSDSVKAQSYSQKSLAGLKLFRVIIDLPAAAARCGPNRRDLKSALYEVVKPSSLGVVLKNRTADATIELEVSGLLALSPPSGLGGCARSAERTALRSNFLFYQGNNKEFLDFGMSSGPKQRE